MMQHPIPIYFIIPHWITPLAAHISRVTLYRVDPAILYFFYDTNMIGNTIVGVIGLRSTLFFITLWYTVHKGGSLDGTSPQMRMGGT